MFGTVGILELLLVGAGVIMVCPGVVVVAATFIALGHTG